MGTTLTGTTPQDTYDSLIKVTDNGPISGTAKYLSDGLGNDSALALSTARVGVGTNTPAEKLDVNGAIAVRAATASFATASAVGMIDQPTSGITRLLSFGPDVSTLGSFQFYTTGANNTGGVSPMTITSAGNVGIGTSAPAGKLHVAGGDIMLGASYALKFSSTSFITPENNVSGAEISTGGTFVVKTGVTPTERIRVSTDGLTFNGDTAAANALDDYEEGTWTMGVTFGGASVGVTTSINTGNYTKIGRQVTISGQIALSNKGSSTGIAQITGLPFAVANNAANFAAPSFRTELISNTGIIQGYTNIATTLIPLEQVSVLGAATAITNADFSNSTTIIVSATYFV